MSELVALFVSALLSATVLPGSSEVVLVALISGGASPWLAGSVATVGNTLGSLVTYLLGLGLISLSVRLRARWLPDERRLDRARAWFARFGVWALLFAWLPLIGDALALVAGVLRIHPAVFVVLVAIGKALRYAVIIVFTQQFVAPIS